MYAWFHFGACVDTLRRYITALKFYAWDWHFVTLCLAYFLWGEVWPALIYLYIERERERVRERDIHLKVYYI